MNAQEFLEHISTGLTPGTLLSYSLSLASFTDYFKDRDVTKLTSRDVSDWIRWLLNERKNKPQCIRNKVIVVKRFYTWLFDQGHIPETQLDIFLRRKLPKLVRVPTSKVPISEEQHRHIMAFVRSGRTKSWWVTACLVGWHTGLRISDIAALRWENINWDEELIRVMPIKTKRFQKFATIPMDEELAGHLLKLRDNPYYASPWVIPDMAGYYQADPDLLEKQFKYIVRVAGFPHLHIHCYRHGFVTRLINAGVSPIIIASMTAQSVQQIESYAHVSDQAKREALEKARAALYQAKLHGMGIKPVPLEFTPNEVLK